jgi:predicted nuclease of predicted toxin-antitoxin system
MRFLANENIPMPSVRHLRQAGHDVAAIVEDSPGISDRDILARAASEQRYILTFDRDYGELIYRRGLPPPPGVIYFRFNPLTPTELAEHHILLIGQPSIALHGQFNVVERKALRQRPLPT